jgi:hypothetical protein
MTSRLLAVASTLVAPALALGGCAIQAGSGLSAEEARTELYSVLDETESAVGGVWENQDDPTARGCVIPLWVDGEMYPALRIGPAPEDPAGTLDEVVEAWADWGYTVRETKVGDVVELQGRNEVQELIVFRVSSEAMTLQGESECRPASA